MGRYPKSANNGSNLLETRLFVQTQSSNGGLQSEGVFQGVGGKRHSRTSSSSSSDDVLDSDGDSLMANGVHAGPPITSRRALSRRAPLKSILRPPSRFSPYGPSPRPSRPSPPLARRGASKPVTIIPPLPTNHLALRNLAYSQRSLRRSALERAHEVRTVQPFAGDIRGPSIHSQVREARAQLQSSRSRTPTSFPPPASSLISLPHETLDDHISVADSTDHHDFKSCRSRTPTPFLSPPGSSAHLSAESLDDPDGLQGPFDDASASDSVENYNETHTGPLTTIQEEEEEDNADRPAQQTRSPPSSAVPQWLTSYDQSSRPAIAPIAGSRESTPSFGGSPEPSLPQGGDVDPNSPSQSTTLPVREPHPHFELAPTVCPSTRSSANTELTGTRRTPLGNASKRPWHYIAFVLNNSPRQLCLFIKPCTGDITKIMHAVQTIGLVACLFTKSATVLEGANGPVTYQYGHDWWMFVTKDKETYSAFNKKRSEGWNPGEFGTRIGKLGWGCDASFIEKEFDILEEAAAKGESVMLPSQFMAGPIGAMVVWCSMALVG